MASMEELNRVLDQDESKPRGSGGLKVVKCSSIAARSTYRNTVVI